MLTRGLTCAVIAAAIAITTAQTSAPPSTIDAADLAWDRGDYIGALRAYLEILDSTGGDAAVEPIALRTGELFQTTELTAEGSGPQPSADGRTVAYPPQMSADGRFATYETGAGAARMTHVVSTSQPSKVIARFQGWGAAFSPDGTRIAFLRAAEVPAAPGSTPAARVMLRETAGDREIEIESGAIRKDAVMPANGGVVLFTGSAGATPSQVYSAAEGRAPVALTSDEGNKVLAAVSSTGASALYTVRLPGGGRGGRGASP